jgi:hypothetical protein
MSIKFLRLISFGGLYVRAIGFENDHFKHECTMEKDFITIMLMQQW